MPTKEQTLFKTHPPSPKFPIEKTIQAIEALQELENNFYMGAKEVVQRVPFNDPLLLWVLSDLHLASLSTNPREAQKFVQTILSNPHAGVIAAGDIINSIKGAYLRTNVDHTAFGISKQIAFARALVLEPLAKEGRIASFTSNHVAHEGWADDFTINLWSQLVEGLNIPLLRNGGILKIIFPNSHAKNFQIFHNTPNRSSKDPLHGVHVIAQKYSASNCPDAVIGAHIHHAGVAVENTSEGSVVLVQAGTLEGNNNNHPFGVKMGWDGTDPLGQNLIAQTRRRNQPEKRLYPTMTIKHGEIAHKAITLFDRTESQRITDELIETIHHKLEDKPKIIFNSRKSRKSKEPYRENGPFNPLEQHRQDYAQQFRLAAYNIISQLPMQLIFLSGSRLGSSRANLQNTRETINLIASNPHRTALLLRGIIDDKVSGNPNRFTIVNASVQLFRPISQQILGLMLDTGLLSDSWRKKIGREDTGQPFAVGTYMAKTIRPNLPLLENSSTISLTIGPKGSRLSYTGNIHDHLAGRGRSAKATAGLRSIYHDIVPQKRGFTVGGHMLKSGFSTIHDPYNPETFNPHFLAPGWLADNALWSSKANLMPGGPGGLSLIFMPGKSQKDYLVFPTGSQDETKYLHTALLLYSGLNQLNLTHQVLKRTK